MSGSFHIVELRSVILLLFQITWLAQPPLAAATASFHSLYLSRISLTIPYFLSLKVFSIEISIKLGNRSWEMKICFQWWSKFGSIIFLITVIFKLVKNSEKSKRPKPPSTTCLFITSLLILSRLQPHKKWNVRVSILLIRDLGGLMSGIAR